MTEYGAQMAMVCPICVQITEDCTCEPECECDEEPRCCLYAVQSYNQRTSIIHDDQCRSTWPLGQPWPHRCGQT